MDVFLWTWVPLAFSLSFGVSRQPYSTGREAAGSNSKSSEKANSDILDFFGGNSLPSGSSEDTDDSCKVEEVNIGLRWSVYCSFIFEHFIEGGRYYLMSVLQEDTVALANLIRNSCLHFTSGLLQAPKPYPAQACPRKVWVDSRTHESFQHMAQPCPKSLWKAGFLNLPLFRPKNIWLVKEVFNQSLQPKIRLFPLFFCSRLWGTYFPFGPTPCWYVLVFKGVI